jgi:hypothetical protein
LLFFYTVMLLAVGHLDGFGVLHYHYTLIIGMLQNTDTFLLVCFAWLLYQLKCLTFVIRTLQQPTSQFLYVINGLPGLQRFGLTLLMMTVLFLPMGWYGWLIIGVAWYQHDYTYAIVLFTYMLLFCCVCAAWVVHALRFPGNPSYRISRFSRILTRYPGLLIRFVVEKQKVLFITIKLFTCALLYGFARVNDADTYDPQFPFLFFGLAVLSNGILIHRIRSFEETFMEWYRGAPVSQFRRWLEYILVYGILFVPELITIGCLTPVHLHTDDALHYALCGFGLVMLLNSICFLEDFTMKQYLRVILVVLCVQYFFVLSNALTALSILYFILASVIFFNSYYLFEKRPASGNS